jgi:glycosyltransferase involved in cell wall biosynthesis
MTYRIGFVVENALGHATHLANLIDRVALEPEIVPSWFPIPYENDDIIKRIPGLPFSVRLSLRARRQIKHQLQYSSLDVLYMHTQALAILNLDIMARVPTIISLDATPQNFDKIANAYDAKTASGWMGRVKTRRFRRMFGLAKRIIAWSEWVSESLVRHYAVDPKKIELIPSGIDLSRWTSKSAYSAAATPLRLLFVGGDFERKGGRLLLDVFRRNLAGRCELDIVTRDCSVAAEAGVRIHHGMMSNSPELKKLYDRADVFVLPSLGDATPFAVLEAMACGLPVIATAVGALGEAVCDRVTGYLISPGNNDALAAKILALAEDRKLLAALGQEGRRHAERQFDAAVNYCRLIACLKLVAQA